MWNLPSKRAKKSGLAVANAVFSAMFECFTAKGENLQPTAVFAGIHINIFYLL